MGRWASKEIKFYLGSKSDNSISIALKVSFQEIYLKISIDKTHRIWYLYCCSAEKNLHCRSNKGEHRRIQSPIKHPRYSFLLKQLTALTDFATSFILDVWQGFQYNCATSQFREVFQKVSEKLFSRTPTIKYAMAKKNNKAMMLRQDIKLLHLSMMYMYNTHSLLFEKEYDL